MLSEYSKSEIFSRSEIPLFRFYSIAAIIMIDWSNKYRLFYKKFNFYENSKQPSKQLNIKIIQYAINGSIVSIKKIGTLFGFLKTNAEAEKHKKSKQKLKT